MTIPWYQEAIFYHIYPLGLCGAPARNDYQAAPVERLQRLGDWIPHLQQMGVNAVYFGPVFESESHGYDPVNYYAVDRRLGTKNTLQQVIEQCHAQHIKVVLDGVFHHVSRDFFAFKDLQQQQQASRFKEWFCGIDFTQRSPYQDPFAYQGWNGHLNLVKLNVAAPSVREHLFEAVRQWITEFQIDGLRLDVADVLDFGFMQRLAAFTKSLKADFWLMGEVVHGDYTRWANAAMLDATTNYECYKGLYSSHNDKNYFEIAYALNRQFGRDAGIYQQLYLYNFADNHDVDRVASKLHDPAHLYPLYLLLFTMPGIPALYYGSEWGLEGRKTPDGDQALRPELHVAHLNSGKQADLQAALTRMIHLRQASAALKHGTYTQLLVAAEQFAFLRETPAQKVIVAVNASHNPVTVHLPIQTTGSKLIDGLNGQQQFPIHQGQATIPLPPCWGRILDVY